MPVSPARTAAFDILMQVEREDAYASELLHAARYARLSTADHALATELVMGVLRWRSRLDRQIAARVAQRLDKLDLEVLVALRLAAYQLSFLQRVPARAAVHESVELAKRARKRSAAPLVNAVLRKLATTAMAKATLAEDLKAPADVDRPKVKPERIGSANSAQLAEHFAHPAWLVERWWQHFGAENTERICHFDQAIPEIAIRLRDPLTEDELRADGVNFVPGELLASARRISSGNLTRTRALREQRVVIQDEASQLVALLVGQGASILDCCAAPGGKARLLADRNPDARIVAVDLHPHRAGLLGKLVSAKNLQVIAANICQLPLDSKFDRVLADVPCSGTGTLARHPEIKWRLKPEDLSNLQTRQIAILRSALEYVAPGGTLVYSTCSLEPEENSDVVEQALGDGSSRLIDCRQELERLQKEGELVWADLDSLLSGPYLRTLPGVHPCDGFFAAILERI